MGEGRGEGFLTLDLSPSTAYTNGKASPLSEGGGKPRKPTRHTSPAASCSKAEVFSLTRKRAPHLWLSNAFSELWQRRRTKRWPSNIYSGLQGMSAPPSEDSSERWRFWRDPAYLTALAALLAAMIPITAAVNGYFALELEREKFASELRLKYVDRALDTSKDSTYRENFLRFLMQATSSSELLHKWAEDQLRNASEIRRVRAEIAKLNASLRTASDQLAVERGRQLRNQTAASQREQVLHERLASALGERDALEAKLHAAELKAGYSPSKMVERTPAPNIFRVKLGLYQPRGPAYFPEQCNNIRISGENFGESPGRIYEVLSIEDSTRVGPLEVWDWSDTEVVANCPSLSGSKVIVLTTADSRSSKPAEALRK